MNKSCLIIATILLGLVGQNLAAQWTRGYEATVAWNTGNPLQYSTAVPRDSGVFRVDFGFKMRAVPLVMVNPNIYDWQSGMPVHWELSIEEVTEEYFKYKIKTNSPRQFYTLFFNWIAVVGEETLQVKYMKFNTKSLSTSPANGNRVTDTFKVSFDFVFDNVPTVWTSFVGQSWIGGTYYEINQEPKNIDKTGFTLEVWSEWSKLDSISLAIWAVDPSLSYTLAKVVSYPRWSSRNPSEAFEYEDYQVTDEFRKKGMTPQPVSGMQGFKVRADRNMRLQCQRDVYDTTNTIQKVRMGTWWDSVMERLTYFQLIFVISPDKCVKLFSECNYQGEELASICETTPSPALAAKYHGKNVKSIKIPKGVVISLYEKENYQGKVKEFTKDESCIKDWAW